VSELTQIYFSDSKQKSSTSFTDKLKAAHKTALSKRSIDRS